MTIQQLEATCKQVRRDIINMTADAGSGHPGGSLSATEILVALYFSKMNIDPKKPQGYGSRPAGDVQGARHARPVRRAWPPGIFPDGGVQGLPSAVQHFAGTPGHENAPGWTRPPARWGQGASIATGMALGAKHTRKTPATYTPCWATASAVKG